MSVLGNINRTRRPFMALFSRSLQRNDASAIKAKPDVRPPRPKPRPLTQTWPRRR
jgi:hypothetical protein